MMSNDANSSPPFNLPNATEIFAKLTKGVGFLRRGEAFETGDVDLGVFEQLCELSQNPIAPWCCAGVHHCDLCRFTGNSVATYRGKAGNSGLSVSATSSTTDLWIPG